MVFAYLYMHYPEEEEHISDILNFWDTPPLTDEEMKAKIYYAHVPAECFNEDGEFCPEYEHAEYWAVGIACRRCASERAAVQLIHNRVLALEIEGYLHCVGGRLRG